jgi:glycosyltransferase involved in cell wall biosynthesis
MRHPRREKLKLSVVIATYNRRDSLLRLLLSLACQSLDPKGFEVIVVNDGSEDGTDQALAALEVSYPLHVIHQANQGQTVARQNGALKATGEILLFLDDDMDPCPKLLAEHLQIHGKDEAVVLGHIKAPTPSFNRPNFVWYEEQFLARLYESIQTRAIKPCWKHFYTGNVSMPRKSFLAAGGFDATMQRGEDVELGYRLSGKNIHFYFASKAETIHYSDHGSFLSWLKTAYHDGIFRIRMFKKLNVVSHSHPVMEYHRRHPLSRLMLRFSIGSDSVRKWLSQVLRICGDTLFFLHCKRLCYYAYSAIYTINYFAGIRDEMGGLTEFTRELQHGCLNGSECELDRL